MNKELLSRVALNVADEQFQDFSQDIYIDALKRANRLIGKRYSIMHREIYFDRQSVTTSFIEPLQLKLPGYKDAVELRVNNYLYLLGNPEKENYRYSKEMYEDHLILEYSPKTDQDKLYFKYIVMPNVTDNLDDYALPERFQDEQIKETTKIICGYGIAKFTDIKLDKYARILSMLDRNTVDGELFNHTPLKIKVDQYP
jgi:hypothetical protein